MIRYISYLRCCVFLGLMLFSANAYALHDIVIINNNPAPADTVQRLLSSSPYDRQTVDANLGAVALTFSQGIRSEKSFIKVYDMYNTQINDGTVNVSGTMMSAPLPTPLQPGKYRVKWRAICTCPEGTDLDDFFHFTVK